MLDQLSLKPNGIDHRIVWHVDEPDTATILSIIIPTLNERENVEPLLASLAAALPYTAWEAIFVDDDSQDGTAEYVRDLARRDPQVRCLQRIGRRGLATACIEGVLASASPYVAVIDADLQHDERLLPQMLRALQDGADLVVGSRYVAGGGIGDWGRRRARASGIATHIARIICKADVADPLSGFCMCRREVFERALRRMTGQGFKVLLDLLASSPEPLLVRELPYSFRERQRGESKLDTLIVWEYCMLLADKLVGRIDYVLLLGNIVGRFTPRGECREQIVDRFAETTLSGYIEDRLDVL